MADLDPSAPLIGETVHVYVRGEGWLAGRVRSIDTYDWTVRVVLGDGRVVDSPVNSVRRNG